VTVRFLADEDVDGDLIRGLRTREPAMDVLDVKTAGLRGMADPALLELAAQQDRILITHDRHTMTRHFIERLDAGKPAPGVLILPQQRSAIGEVIESLLLVWTASRADEWRNQIAYLPFR
jgi:predicted nuclease of predicted toxin-antitoxin system